MPKAPFYPALSEKSVSDYLPYGYHLTPTIISLSNGHLVAVIRLVGRSHESASAVERADWVRELNTTIRAIAKPGTIFYNHIIRRKITQPATRSINNWYASRLDQRYQRKFEGVALMANDLYYSIVFDPIGDDALSAFSKADKLSPTERKRAQTKAIREFEEIIRNFKAALDRYTPTVLSTYDDNGFVFSEPAEFFSYLINGETLKVPVARDRIKHYLPTARPLFDRHGELGEQRQLNGSQLFGMLEITDYPEQSEPGHLNVLLYGDQEFVLTQSFSVRSPRQSLAFLKRHMRHLEDSKDAGTNQISALEKAMEGLVEKQFVMGEHHATIRVWGTDSQSIREAMADMRADLAGCGIVVAPLDEYSLEAGYWAQFPGNPQYRPRPCPITSLNFLSLAPLHNFHLGKPDRNPWGPAISMFKTESGTPHYFSFHPTPLLENSFGSKRAGNTTIIGATGTGKTVLLGFLAAQAKRIPAKIVTLDKDYGMELQIRAMGGRYFPLCVGQATGWNPCKLDPTAANVAWIKRLVANCISAGGPVSFSDTIEIDEAVNTVMFQLNKEDRRFSTILQNMPHVYNGEDGSPSVHARFAVWCADGEKGWLFDNADDLLDLSEADSYGFDLTELYDYPGYLELATDYIMYRTDEMLDGTPFIYIVDEYWKPLGFPRLATDFKNRSKTIRKLSGIFVLATQEPEDCLNSDAGKTAINNSQTLIFLPNPKARQEDYVKGFKLTQTEFEIVRDLPEASRKFLIKQGGMSAVAELNLAGFDEFIPILSGTPDGAMMAREIIESMGDDPQVWIPAYLDRIASLTTLEANNENE